MGDPGRDQLGIPRNTAVPNPTAGQQLIGRLAHHSVRKGLDRAAGATPRLPSLWRHESGE